MERGGEICLEKIDWTGKILTDQAENIGNSIHGLFKRIETVHGLIYHPYMQIQCNHLIRPLLLDNYLLGKPKNTIMRCVQTLATLLSLEQLHSAMSMLLLVLDCSSTQIISGQWWYYGGPITLMDGVGVD